MKNLLSVTFTLILLTCTMSYLSAQTMKERIDEAKIVKVYYKNGPIAHSPNTAPMMGAQGTGCEKFGETTPLPTEYIDALNELVDMLNKGFNTTAFVAGDFSTVPARTTGLLKGEPDWVALNEPLMFFVNTWGLYSVKRGSTGRVNCMAIESYLNVYYVKDGKVKIAGTTMLASKWAEPIATQKCDDYAYFVEKFPAASLAEPFKALLVENTNDFIAKDMKKYEKAMSKKK